MIAACLFLAVAGAALVVYGVISMKTSISWRHRPKVAEENRAVFGKLKGTAQIIGGSGIILFGVLSLLAVLTAKPIWMTIGMYLTTAMLAVAICIYFYTMMKYNKGF